MPASLLTSILSVAVGALMLVLVVLVPTVVMTDIKLAAIAQNAARVAAITDSQTAVSNEIASAMQKSGLPTSWNGQTLYTDQVQTGSETGFALAGGSTATNTTVTIYYNMPVLYDKAFTLVGGVQLAPTFPVSQASTYINETQYTGTGT